MEDKSPTMPYMLLRNFRVLQTRPTSQGQTSYCEYYAPNPVECPGCEARDVVFYDHYKRRLEGWAKGIYPPPAALTGFPGRGVCPAQGLVARLLAPSPLQPPDCRGVTNPSHRKTKKASTSVRHWPFWLGWAKGIEPSTTGTTIRGSTTELHPPSGWCNVMLRG